MRPAAGDAHVGSRHGSRPRNGHALQCDTDKLTRHVGCAEFGSCSVELERLQHAVKVAPGSAEAHNWLGVVLGAPLLTVLGTKVSRKKKAPEPAPEPVKDIPVAPPVPPAPRTYSDSAAEELDVPDFLK